MAAPKSIAAWRQGEMKLTMKNIIILITVISFTSACNGNLFASPTPAPTPTSTLTYTPQPTNTIAPTKTPQPISSPTPMYADLCTVSGSPESFSPTMYPDYLLNVDKAILSQRNQKTERNIDHFQSYGAATYGSQTTYHALCHEEMPTQNTPRSYCAFERVDSTIHVISGKVRGTPETVKNESYLVGKEGWVRLEGGEWHQSWTLTDAEMESITEAYKISPFYYSENNDCETEKDYPGQRKYCFKINIPEFFMQVFQEEVTYVNCVNNNQGVLWVDPQTLLPTRLDLSINAAVTFSGQESDEFPYNVNVKMSEVYQSFNENYSYPKPK